MLKRSKKFKRGFTYVELMVSIAIIAVLSVSSITLFSSYKRTNDVRIAALKLASDIRQAQNYALGLKEFNGNPPTGGWGINLQTGSNNKYIIFADIGSTPDYIYSGSSELFSSISIKQAQINSITVDGVSALAVNIVFEPPDPTIHICTSVTSCNHQSVAIQLKGSAVNNNAVATVSINNLGLIEVN